MCFNCGAYVGCHKGTIKPLGTLANEELRGLRNQAHSSFDPIWQTRKMKRRQAYKWLAEKLGISEKDCHIAKFNKEKCLKVIQICESWEPVAQR